MEKGKANLEIWKKDKNAKLAGRAADHLRTYGHMAKPLSKLEPDSLKKILKEIAAMRDRQERKAARDHLVRRYGKRPEFKADLVSIVSGEHGNTPLKQQAETLVKALPRVEA